MPYLVEDARQEALSRAAVDEEHLELYRALEATSYIVVPLEARGRLLGTISLGTGESRRRFGAVDLELAHEIARRAAPGDRQRAPLRHRAAVVRTARHAARLGAGRDRLLGPGPPLHPRQRRARRDQRAHSRGARREAAGRGDRRARARARAALPPRARDGRAGRAHRVDRRRGAADGRAPPLALELLPGAHRRRRGDRRRRRDHGDHRPEARRRPAAPARRGRRALLELARPGGDRLADRPGGGAEARRHVQRLPRRRRRRSRRVACVSADPEVQPVLESLPGSFALAEPEQGRLAGVYRSAEPLLLQTVPAEYLDELSRFGVDPDGVRPGSAPAR